jgi:DNA-binding LytR/AlgR family response regulator
MKGIRTVLIEDEAATARHLAHSLQSVDSNISIVAMLESVMDAVGWFTENASEYDLVFSDIRLRDGLSFDIFKKVLIDKPVVFVTAYNDYAIQAFKSNGIDYILKPFDEQEIRMALDKFNKLLGPKQTPTAYLSKFAELLEQVNSSIKPYKKSFLVNYRDKLIPLETAKIAWFYTANEVVYAQTMDSRQYIMEYTLEQLQNLLDPELFFRVNRQFIINCHAVVEIEHFFNGRLSVKLHPTSTEKVLVSKARAPFFKNWMSR